MRFRWAFVASAVLVGGLLAYHWWVMYQVTSAVQEAHKAAIQAGLITDDAPSEVGLPLSHNMITLLKLDHILVNFWYLALLLILTVCFGAAAILPRRALQPAVPSNPALTTRPSNTPDMP